MKPLHPVKETKTYLSQIRPGSVILERCTLFGNAPPRTRIIVILNIWLSSSNDLMKADILVDEGSIEMGYLILNKELHNGYFKVLML